MAGERLVLPAAEGRPLRSGARPRVAVAFAGEPQDPSAWSGIPASLCHALTRLDVEVVPLVALPGRQTSRALELAVSATTLRRARSVAPPGSTISVSRALAQLSPALARARSVAAARALGRAGSVDGAVQIGSNFSLPDRVRYVTFEDMTIAQVRLPDVSGFYPPWHLVSGRAADELQRRQADVYARSHACVAATHWAASSIVSDYGMSEDRVVVAGFGAQVRTEPKQRDWSRPRFLFVGIDWERKNGAAVLRAFDAVRRSAAGARLDVVGGHPRLSGEGIVGHGHLRREDPGEADLLAELYENATCFVMPSLHEAAGMVYVEAGHAGVPSVGTSRGGAATMIGRGGRIVDPDDDAAIAAALLELSDGETAARLGALAHSHAQRLTWDLVAQRVLRALGLPGPASAVLADYFEPPHGGDEPSE